MTNNIQTVPSLVTSRSLKVAERSSSAFATNSKQLRDVLLTVEGTGRDIIVSGDKLIKAIGKATTPTAAATARKIDSGTVEVASGPVTRLVSRKRDDIFSYKTPSQYEEEALRKEQDALNLLTTASHLRAVSQKAEAHFKANPVIAPAERDALRDALNRSLGNLVTTKEIDRLLDEGVRANAA